MCEAEINFDFKSRQTNKKTRGGQEAQQKKGGKEAESERASRGVHVMCCAVENGANDVA